MSRVKRFIRSSALSAALFSTAAGAGNGSLTAKNIFLDPQNHPNTVGIRYDVLLERPDRTRAEVAYTHEFKSGDRFWLRMDVMSPVYVYVLNRTFISQDKGIELVRDSDNAHTPPAGELPRLVFGPEKTAAGKSRIIPGSKAMAFDLQPGAETLYVVFSAQPLGLEAIFDKNGHISPSNGAVGAVLHDLNQKLAAWAANANFSAPPKEGAKGIVLDHGTDNNAYCVEQRPNQPVMVEVSLRHSI
jgi:hypothetical protein